MRIHKDQKIDELMQYKLPHVQPSEDDTSNVSFLKYLQILLYNIENKLTKVLPKEDLNDLAISKLVNYGSILAKTINSSEY